MPAIRLMRLVVASDARQLCASLRLSSMRPYRPTAIEFFSGLSDERQASDILDHGGEFVGGQEIADQCDAVL